MKITKILALVIFTITLICILAVASNARWWDENPFEDVKSDAWYYDAVRVCYDNGIFKGTSETTFGVSGSMTRAMAVTALASADGYDKAAYKDTAVFDDVPVGKWYAAPVAWAAEKGITSGTGGGLFSPDARVTREQFAVMLYKYAAYKGIDLTHQDYSSHPPFIDYQKISKWARNALYWAYDKGVIAGVDNGGALYLAPYVPIAREQAAQMTYKLLCLAPVREINGNDLSLYRIVYDPDEIPAYEDGIVEYADKLAGYIKDCFGLELPVVPDETEPYEYEILVGRTNREDMGLVTVDRDSFESDQKFLCQVQGNRLIICGIDSDSHEGDHDHKTYNVKGTRNAVFYFGEYVLGVETYSESNGGIYKFSPDPVISLPDGWTYIDGPFFRSRVFYMSGGVLGTGRYNSEVSELMYDWMDLVNPGEYHSDTPCMSDETHIQAVIKNVKKELDKKPYASIVGIGIMDSNGYCKCENCKAIYRQYKAQSATLCLLVNRVCEAIEEDYPGVKVCFGAYTYTDKPPEGLVMHKNAIVEYYSIACCYGHDYLDKTCPLNKVTEDYVNKWNEITEEMWFWDHCGNFELMMTPVPDWDSMRINIRFFAEQGCTQVLMNSVLDSGYRYSDFGYLRGYMYSALYRDPFMSEEEFNYRLNKGLEAYYGAGWRNIREYIDTIAELGNHKHHRHHAGPVSYYDYAEVCEVADHLDELWADAFAKAEGNEKMTERLTLANHSWIFLRQCATWESRCKNGTEEQRAAYVAANEELCQYIFDHNISWTEGTLDTLDQYDPMMSPEHW